MKNINEMS